MEKYNYHEAVKQDVLQWIDDNKNYVFGNEQNKEDLYNEMYDILFVDDSVTGNGSGSYTFNAWQAEENLCHNLDLLADACAEFGSEMDILKDGAEACDVTIRCYLLPQILDEVLDEVLDEN